MIGMPAMPGLWPDYYLCYRHNIRETIDSMLSFHKEDFPYTDCYGYTVINQYGKYKIYPIVCLMNDNCYDFYLRKWDRE